MKNLKKVLALVLAFACAFTMFAGAAFTDAADINADNADAVELLTTLGIIKGYEDGSFDPEGVVTRAEMAKMIYSIRNGGNDNASAHVGNTTSFTDISGHWAEGYIKYLQNTGIVAGKSATKFVPNAQVTTTEAMKMALALAGYDEKNAGLTGADWSKNTLTLATTIGLTDDVASAMSAGCTRQDAAQILANVLEATAVRYSAIVENFVNDSKTGLSYGGDPITVGYKWMDLSIYVGRMMSSGELNLDGPYTYAGKDRFTVDVDTVNGVDADKVNFNNNPWWWKDNLITCKDGKDHTDLVGMEVKVLTGDKVDEVYGVYATATSNVVETTMDQIDVQSDDKVKIDDVTYDTKNTDWVYVDLEGVEEFDNVFGEDGRVAADTVKIIDWNDDGKYETILVNTVTVAKVNSVSSSRITIGETGSRDESIFGNTYTIDFDGNSIYEDVAKDDFVAITKNVYDDSWNVVKVESAEGTVNGLVENKREIRIDGEWYTLANNKDGAQADDSDLYTVDGSRDVFTNGDEITIYAIGSVVYYADSARGNDANRSVLMVYDKQVLPDIWLDRRDQVKAIFADGDKETITLDFDPADAEDAVTSIRGVETGVMYYYVVNNDDEYALYRVDDDHKVGYDKYVDSDGLVDSNKIADYAIADDAVVFAMIGDDDADVYTGKTVKDADEDLWKNIDDKGGVLIDETKNINYARMFNVALNDGLDEATDYAYLLTNAVRSQDDKQYIEYTMWTQDGEIVEALEATNAHRENEMLAGDVITYTLDGKNADGVQLIKSVSKIEDNYDDVMEAAIMGCEGDDLRVITKYRDEVFTVDDDTIAIYIRSGNKTMEQGIADETGFDHRAKRVDNTADEYQANALIQLDNDGSTVKFILIDLDGELSDAKFTDDDDKGVHELQPGENLADIFDEYRTVTVPGTYTIPAGTVIEVESWASLTFDNLVLNGTINGDFTADELSGSGKINGDVTVNNPVTESLDSLNATAGSTLTLGDAYTTAKNDLFFAGEKGDAGVLNPSVPENTYTWTEDINNTDDGWLSVNILTGSGALAANGTDQSADLDNLFKLYSTVEVTGDDLDVGTSYEIPAGKTLVIKDAQTSTANLEKITGKDATAKLVLKTEMNRNSGAEWFYGENESVATNMDSNHYGAGVPAGTYVYSAAKTGWLLTTEISNDITFTTAPSKQDLANAFYATSGKVVVNGVAVDIDVNVPAGETLSINTSPTGIIAGAGTVEVTGSFNSGSFGYIGTSTVIVNYNKVTADFLSKIDQSLVKTIKFAQDTAIGDDQNVLYRTFEGVSVALSGTISANTTFEFDANAGGANVAGYVQQ